MTTTSPLTWLGAAWRGAKTGAALAGLYAAAFCLYVCVRSIWTIAPLLEPFEALRTAIVMIFSLMVPVIVIGLMMALIAAVVGALTASAVFALLQRLNPARVPDRATAIGLGFALAVALLLYVAIQSVSGGHLTPQHLDAYVFWVALPLLIYVVVGMIGARRINRLNAA